MFAEDRPLQELIVSWTLTGIPAISGAILYFWYRKEPGMSILSPVKVGVFWGAIISIIVGTLAYGVFRGLKIRRGANQTRIDRVLFGEDQRVAAKWLTLLILGLILLFVFLTVLRPGPLFNNQGKHVSYTGAGMGTLVGVGSLLMFGAAVHGYRNDGLVVCWMLVSVPIGFFTLSTVFRTQQLQYISLTDIAIAIGIPLLGGVLFGTIGFVVGVASRHLQEFRKSNPAVP